MADSEGRPMMVTSYSAAAALVEQGEYARALPSLRCLADRGQGYEIAQYLAGHTAIAMADLDTTPTILQPELRVEGFDRLLIAAEAGWPSAQAELARLYWRAGTESALSDAAYWASVYRQNPRDRALGLDRLRDSIEAEIDAALPPDLAAEVDARVAGYRAQAMPARETRPECAAMARSGPMMPGGAGGRAGRPQGGRGGPGGGRGGGGGGPF